MESNWILYVATYPPRECGIATFTKDLITAMDKKFSPKIKSKILVMNNSGTNIYKNNEDVLFDIDETDISAYKKAAERENAKKVILILNKHDEFLIFG